MNRGASLLLCVLCTVSSCAPIDPDKDAGVDAGLDAGSDGGATDGGAADGGADAGWATSGSLALLPSRARYLTYFGGKALIVIDAQVQPPGAAATLEVATSEALPLQVLPTVALTGSAAREVLVTPSASHVGRSVDLTVRLMAGGRQLATGTMAVETTSWPPPSRLDAARDAFVDFLAANRSELGVSRATTWDWWGEEQMLVVAHHLYLSDRGQLFLSRHVTIPPNDWVLATFRPRDRSRVTWAGKIDSITAGLIVHDEPVPDAGR